MKIPRIVTAGLHAATGSAGNYFGRIFAKIKDTTGWKGVGATYAESERKYRTIFENVQDVYYRADIAGNIIEISPSITFHSGYSREEVIGRSADFFYATGDDRAKTLAAINKNGKVADYELLLARKDGSHVYGSLNAHFLYDSEGRQIGVEGLIRDISVRKKCEKALHVAKEEAEKANRAKSDFLAGMSHEIRTPMNAIMGMADLLSESGLTEEQKKYVGISKRAGENLLTLVNGILDLAKVEAGRIVLESTPFDLSRILGRVCDFMRVKARAKGIQIDCVLTDDVPTALVGDPHRLQQVLINLVNNAVKFTERGTITVRGETIRERPAACSGTSVEIRFSIADTGIGIPGDKLDQIFDKFIQADSSTTRQYGGTGLGLAISKKLVQMMGGIIWVESEPGMGSTFFFTARFGLDRNAMKNAAGKDKTRPQELQAAGLRPLQILLVEDNADNRLLFLSFLKKTAHTVAVAVNGAEAVAKFKTNRYDLILMDVQMPLMDGYTATAKIRNWESETGSDRTPIVALTAHAMREDEQKSLAAGCDSHLTKPIKKNVLLEVIDRYATA